MTYPLRSIAFVADLLSANRILLEEIRFHTLRLIPVEDAQNKT